MSKNTTPLKQLTLNFGQKDREPIKCLECNLLYNSNDKEDSQFHKKIHAELETTLKYTSLKGEKIVQEYPDGKCIVIESGIDSKQLINKSIQLLHYVDTQLGINEAKKQTNLKESTKIYLFVSNVAKKIVGLCMAEPIEQAFKIEYLNTNSSSFTYNNDSNSTGVRSAVCGINRVWVLSQFRRKHIASRLLDCVRINFLYFKSLHLNELAFSDPTENGQALAKQYTQTDSFFVYNHHH